VNAAVRTGTLETNIPARLDRLPWSRFHWLIVVGLGTVWILDGLEVTIVGALAERLTEDGSGIALSPGQIGVAAAVYVAGACSGALFFGQLTDRFGRKRLFLITLAVYIAATVATAFAFSPLYFYAARFFTGAGIGGEYAAINSAIDELIPARVRGRVDLIINGSYWLGAAAGAAGAIVLLNESIFAKDVGWRVAFGLGAVIGLAILLVRRTVPESPRWLFIHGREDEAEEIVRSIERDVKESTGEGLPEPDETITVRQRERIPFRTIGATAWKLYPRRTVLALSLFVGQAFIYNAFTFNLGTILGDFFKVAATAIPVFFILFAAGNFLGPLLLGRLFDTVGRRVMISTTYLGSAALGAVMAVLFNRGSLTEWTFMAFICATFFLASAGASSAYLTASEIFPMETRALAIAFFFAIGTAVGGISGPLLFGRMIESGDTGKVTIAFLIGSAVMALGGIVAAFLAVRAEQKPLEEVAEPLTAAEAEQGDLEATGERADERRAAEPEDVDKVGARQRADWERRHRERAERRATPLRGSRRYRPGPGSALYSPGMLGTSVRTREPSDTDLDREVDLITRAVETNGASDRRSLARLVGARHWGPGRFHGALEEAVAEGRLRRVGRQTYAPAESQVD
jgi:MFS family permease